MMPTFELYNLILLQKIAKIIYKLNYCIFNILQS